MVQKPDMRGPVYAVLSAMAIAVAPLATKQALGTLNPETFSILWSLLAFMSASIYAVSRGGLSAFRGFGKCWQFVIVSGF